MSRRRDACPSVCARKVSHPTREDAERHADALRTASGFAAVRIYRCAKCGSYYVTSEARRRSLKRGGR